MLVMAMSISGALAMAEVTASLTRVAELKPEEALLVRKVEMSHEMRLRHRDALHVVQAAARVWLAVRARDKELLGASEDLVRHQSALRRATAVFRHATGDVTRKTRVHTLGVLHTSLEGLQAEQRRLTCKLDALLRVSAETSRCVYELQQRQV